MPEIRLAHDESGHDRVVLQRMTVEDRVHPAMLDGPICGLIEYDEEIDIRLGMRIAPRPRAK